MAGFVILLVAAWALAKLATPVLNDHWATCTITGKDRGATSSTQSNYRIYTAQCGVLGDHDSWLRGKVTSADLFGQLQPGRTYRLHIVGVRFPLTSTFPNILAVQPA
jgi:hypothetical protein